MRFSITALLLICGGCKGDVVSDYYLQLRPIVPHNQDPFETGPEVGVLITDVWGNVETHVLGDVNGGTVEMHNMPPLESAFVGLLLYDREAADETFLAFGQAGPFDLSTGGQKVDTDVFVSNFLSMGTLGALGENRIGAAAITTSIGETFLFGGVSSPSSPEAYSDILVMSPLDDADWSFRPVATIESPDGTPLPLVGAEAVLVNIDGTELIYVVGGSTNMRDLALEKPAGFLFDPALREIVWWPQDDDGRPYYTKFEPYVAVLSDESILTISTNYTPTTGGWNIPTGGPSAEIFDPLSKDHTKRVRTLSHPFDGFAVAEVPFQQAYLMCGGGAWMQPSGSEGYMKPRKDCALLSEQLELTALSDLPINEDETGLAFHAMIPLWDEQNSLLLTGGVTTEVRQTEPASPTKSAYILRNPGPNAEWEPVGDLNLARAAHRMVATPDGGAIVFGGADAMGPGYAKDFASVECPERFDPESLTFSILEPCEPTGAGPNPVFTNHPDHEMILIGNHKDGSGGSEFATLPVEAPRDLDWVLLLE